MVTFVTKVGERKRIVVCFIMTVFSFSRGNYNVFRILYESPYAKECPHRKEV